MAQSCAWQTQLALNTHCTSNMFSNWNEPHLACSTTHWALSVSLTRTKLTCMAYASSSCSELHRKGQGFQAVWERARWSSIIRSSISGPVVCALSTCQSAVSFGLSLRMAIFSIGTGNFPTMPKRQCVSCVCVYVITGPLTLLCHTGTTAHFSLDSLCDLHHWSDSCW